MLTHLSLTIRLFTYAVAIAIWSHQAPAMADWGIKSLRIGCNTTADSIHIEPFIAWDGGSSRYPEFNAETADTNNKLVRGSDTFYAFNRNASTLDIDTTCKTKNRVVRIIIKDRELTVIENGTTVVEGLTIGNVWNFSGPVYALTTSAKGAWNECSRESNDGSLVCNPYKSGKKNSSALATANTVTQIQALLSSGADINSHDTDGITALHNAAQFNDFDAARFLLKNGANIDATDTMGRTPLVIAVSKGFSDMALFLLKEGAAVNGVSNGSLTPLMTAANYNQVVAIKLLLDWKADPNIRSNWRVQNGKGITALGLARIQERSFLPGSNPEFESKNKGIIELLLKAGATE